MPCGQPWLKRHSRLILCWKTLYRNGSWPADASVITDSLPAAKRSAVVLTSSSSPDDIPFLKQHLFWTAGLTSEKWWSMGVSLSQPWSMTSLRRRGAASGPNRWERPPLTLSIGTMTLSSVDLWNPSSSAKRKGNKTLRKKFPLFKKWYKNNNTCPSLYSWWRHYITFVWRHKCFTHGPPPTDRM